MDSTIRFTAPYFLWVRLFNIWFLSLGFLLSYIPHYNSVAQSQNKDTVASKKDPEIEATVWQVRESATGLQQLFVRIYAGIESATMLNLPIQLVATKDTLTNTIFKTRLNIYPSYNSTALYTVQSVFPE